jgi:hypothetical protein
MIPSGFHSVSKGARTVRSVKNRTASRSALVVIVFAALMSSAAIAQMQRFSTIGDRTARIALYRQDGNDFKIMAIAEIKGTVEFGPDGIAKGGENAFVRLQTTESPDKWVDITKKELVNGRAIVTTEEGKVFTIFDLQGDFAGKIAIGRVTGEK